MAKRLGFGSYQYELVEGWPKIEIRGAVADITVDSQGRVYAGVRNPQPDGSVGVSRRGFFRGCLMRISDPSLKYRGLNVRLTPSGLAMPKPNPLPFSLCRAAYS